MQTIYSDGVSNITLVDGVMRLDLMKITQVADEKAAVEPVAMLAFSLPAFIRLHEQLNGAIKKMVDQGVIKKNTENTQSSIQENIRFTPSP
jgi:hypothetical protein